MKTYPWINETANSRIDRRIIINGIKIIDITELISLPNRFINRCPAIILADKRMVRVIGRIMFLINSIMIIKLIRIVGVPVGKECMIIDLDTFIHPNIIKVAHIERAKGKMSMIWVLIVKLNGIRLNKLRVAIKKNVEIKIISLEDLGLIRIGLISFLIVKKRSLINFIILFFFEIEIIIAGINNIIQFNLKIEEEGSNIENMFIIIFIC